MASICHLSLPSDGPISTLNNSLQCSTAVAVAIMPFHVISLAPCSCQSPVPHFLQKLFFLKYVDLLFCHYSTEELYSVSRIITWYTHSEKQSCHYVTSFALNV